MFGGNWLFLVFLTDSPLACMGIIWDISMWIVRHAGRLTGFIVGGSRLTAMSCKRSAHKPTFSQQSLKPNQLPR